MALLGPAVAYALLGVLFVFILRLTSKWTLGYKVERKVGWIWWGIALVLSVANLAAANAYPRIAMVVAVLGVILNLALGAAFFGKYAVNESKVSPGFVGGLKLLGISTAMLVAFCTALSFAVNHLLAKG